MKLKRIKLFTVDNMNLVTHSVLDIVTNYSTKPFSINHGYSLNFNNLPKRHNYNPIFISYKIFFIDKKYNENFLYTKQFEPLDYCLANSVKNNTFDVFHRIFDTNLDLGLSNSSTYVVKDLVRKHYRETIKIYKRPAWLSPELDIPTSPRLNASALLYSYGNNHLAVTVFRESLKTEQDTLR